MEDKTVCLDTGVLFGFGKKIIRELKKKKKPTKCLREIKEDGILNRICEKTNYRFTTIITSYEFINRMAIDEGIEISLARNVYLKILNEFNIAEIIPKPKEIKLSHNLMFDLCKLRLDLADGLQIYICSKRKLPFITTEKHKIENMKKFYNKVQSVTEFLKVSN